MFPISTAVNTALQPDDIPAKALPSSERKHNRHCTKSLDSGKKSISKLGLLSIYLIKNDKLLSFIFIKRQKAEQNNLLLSSAHFIRLEKPGGGQKGGWETEWLSQGPLCRRKFPIVAGCCCVFENTFPNLQSAAMPVQLGVDLLCHIPKKYWALIPYFFFFLKLKSRSQVSFPKTTLRITVL